MNDYEAELEKTAHVIAQEWNLKEMVTAERKIIGPVTVIILVTGLLAVITAVYIAGWTWLWAISAPLFLNWLIVYNSQCRISTATGIPTILVNKYWRESQQSDRDSQSD